MSKAMKRMSTPDLVTEWDTLSRELRARWHTGFNVVLSYLDQISNSSSSYLGIMGSWTKTHFFHLPRITAKFYKESLAPWAEDLNTRYPMNAKWVLGDPDASADNAEGLTDATALEEGKDYSAFLLIEIPAADYPLFDSALDAHNHDLIGHNSSDMAPLLSDMIQEHPELVSTQVPEGTKLPWPIRDPQHLVPDKQWPIECPAHAPLDTLNKRVKHIKEKNAKAGG